MPRSSRFDLIAFDSPQDDSDLAEKMAGIFGRLAHQLREARSLRRENDALRDQNHQLREVLSECVASCGQYLAPVMEAFGPEDADRVRAENALESGRRLLSRALPTALG